MQIIKVLILSNNVPLITEIEEVSSEMGEPDCKLINPFQIKQSISESDLYLEPWNSDYTSKNNFMIHSDKILTILDPKPTLLEKYQNLIK